jgi:hypothetical protein
MTPCGATSGTGKVESAPVMLRAPICWRRRRQGREQLACRFLRPAARRPGESRPHRTTRSPGFKADCAPVALRMSTARALGGLSVRDSALATFRAGAIECRDAGPRLLTSPRRSWIGARPHRGFVRPISSQQRGVWWPAASVALAPFTPVEVVRLQDARHPVCECHVVRQSRALALRPRILQHGVRSDFAECELCSSSRSAATLNCSSVFIRRVRCGRGLIEPPWRGGPMEPSQRVRKSIFGFRSHARTGCCVGVRQLAVLRGRSGSAGWA